MPLCHVRPQTLVVLLRRDFDVRHLLDRARLLRNMEHRRTRRVERLRGEPRSPHTERPEGLADEALRPQPAATLGPRL
eukprot:12016144-Alexandrium_andersonii.AAC.1